MKPKISGALCYARSLSTFKRDLILDDIEMRRKKYSISSRPRILNTNSKSSGILMFHT